MIQLINLTKQYGKLAAVDALNLEVPDGQIFGFLDIDADPAFTASQSFAADFQENAFVFDRHAPSLV